MQSLKTMTAGSPAKLIFFFALPLMLGNVFQQLYTVVDTIIVGRGVGMTALAALGTVDWLNWMILGIVMGFTQGFSVRMSQKFGEGDMASLRRTIGLAARLTIIITIITAGTVITTITADSGMVICGAVAVAIGIVAETTTAHATTTLA